MLAREVGKRYPDGEGGLDMLRAKRRDSSSIDSGSLKKVLWAGLWARFDLA
jgi:hypothetical protein